MTLSAHTNNVGYHEQRDNLLKILAGSRANSSQTAWEDFDESYYRFGMLRAISVKPGPVHGDHRSVYGYGPRMVVKIEDDTPVKLHHRWVNPIDQITSSYDYIESFYISERISFNDFRGINWVDNMRAEANVKALNDFSEKKTQLLAELGQARQTINMFADAASTAANVLIGLKTGNLNRVVKGLGTGANSIGGAVRSGTKKAADIWLQYAYGWKPLAQTLKDLQTSAFQEMAKNRILRSQGTAKVSTSFTTYDSDFNGWEVKNEHQGKAKTVLYARLDSPTMNHLENLGLINPASVAWELVPWSFAVDWFSPVGATLEAMTATAGLSFVKGWCSIHQDLEKKAKFYEGRYSPWSQVEDGGSYSEKRFQFDRLQYGAFPKAEFYADLTPFSTGRVLNALALVRQVFR